MIVAVSLHKTHIRVVKSLVKIAVVSWHSLRRFIKPAPGDQCGAGRRGAGRGGAGRCSGCTFIKLRSCVCVRLRPLCRFSCLYTGWGGAGRGGAARGGAGRGGAGRGRRLYLYKVAVLRVRQVEASLPVLVPQQRAQRGVEGQGGAGQCGVVRGGARRCGAAVPV